MTLYAQYMAEIQQERRRERARTQLAQDVALARAFLVPEPVLTFGDPAVPHRVPFALRRPRTTD